MLPYPLLIYISIIGFMFASGVFFDRLASETLKKQIAGYIRDKGNFEFDLTGFTKFFVVGSISKVFSGDIISDKNILKSIAISIISLSVVISIYSIKNSLNPTGFLNFSSASDLYIWIITILIVISSVIIGDIFSILQTALLLNLIGSIRSASDVAFLLLCDIILTINIFVFALPLGLQAAFIVNDWHGVNVELSVTVRNDERPTDLDQIEDGTLKDITSSGQAKYVNASVVARLGNQHTIPQDLEMVAKNIDVSSAVNSMLLLLGKNLRKDVFLSAAEGDIPELSSLLDGKYSTADVHLGSSLTFFGGRDLYGIFFSLSRLAQNVFPLIIQLEPISLRLGPVLNIDGLGLKIPHDRAKEYFVMCDGKVYFSEAVPDINKCKSAVFAAVGLSLISVYKWIDVINPYILDIPITPLAFSCLFLTFSFYIIMSLTFFVIKISSILHFMTFTRNYIDIEKSTFVAISVYAFVLSLPAFLLVFFLYEVVIN